MKIVIGDIHGALRALKQLLEKVNPKQNNLLIFLGDYVDGWSESAQVIDYLIEFKSTHPCIFLKGNHDLWCENWLRTGATSDDWLYSGGLQTIESYERLSNAERARHIEFFNSLKSYYEDDEGRLFVHAGFTSMHGPQKDRHDTNYFWDRSLWELAVATDDRIEKGSIFYPRRLSHHKEIYIGHTPTINFGSLIPMNKMNVWNIDTGAAFTGKLSGLDIDTKNFWQSDSIQSLYPGEKGRNI